MSLTFKRRKLLSIAIRTYSGFPEKLELEQVVHLKKLTRGVKIFGLVQWVKNERSKFSGKKNLISTNDYDDYQTKKLETFIPPRRQYFW